MLVSNGFYRLPDGTPVQAVRFWLPDECWNLYALPRRPGVHPLFILTGGRWYRLEPTRDRRSPLLICDLTEADLRAGLRD